MRAEDRPYAALAHILAIIPLWGIVFNWILWMNFKEKSRDVVFHAHQAIFFQLALLAVFIIAVIFQILCLIISVVNNPVAAILKSSNLVVFIIILMAYILTCLYGAIAVLDGRDFEYPYIGQRLKQSQQ